MVDPKPEYHHRGAQMLALRRVRMAASMPFLRGGFRPFFFGAAFWAVAALAFWMATFGGAVTFPSVFAPLAWHRHEMLFGFAGAAIAGFLLTAIPNWTGRLPIAGGPLAALFGLWLAARMAVLFSGTTGWVFAAALDVGFFLVLGGLAAREVFAAQNKNVPVVALVLFFACANAADHAAAAGLADIGEISVFAGIAVVIVMISLIGGRIVPSFTRNWMTKHGIKDGLPTQPDRFDIGVIAVTAAALLIWLAAPTTPAAGAMLIGAGLLQGARLCRWGGLRAIRDPFVLILHVGYAWISIGLLLLGGSILDAGIARSSALHALTAGAMGTMVLAVMTRATLGHTGHELKANAATSLLYSLVTLGALLRVAAPLGLMDYTIGMYVSAAAWGGAFLLFLVAYGPILFRPRLGDS